MKRHPKNWNEERLGRFFRSRRERGPAGLPILSVTMNDGLVPREELERDLERKTESALTHDEHLLVRDGDIAYNMMRMWQGACGLATSPGNVSPAYVVLEPISGIDARFAYYWFKSSLGRYRLWAYSHGLTEDRLRLYFDDFCQIPVELPPLDEQRRIADALARWDRAIETAEALVAAKRRRYRALRNSLLAAAFVRPSAEWKPFAMGECFDERTEVDPSLPLLSVTGDRGVIPRGKVDRKDTSAADKGAYKVVRPSDIAYNTMRMWQGVFGVSEHTGIVSPAYTVATARPAVINIDFAAHLFRHRRAIHVFYQHSQGLVDDTLNLKFPHFAECRFNLPDLEGQREISAALKSAEVVIAPFEASLESLRAQKRGLMQKLLTGEWRLPHSASEHAA